MPAARGTNLVKDLRTLDERMDAVLGSNHLPLRRRLQLELLRVLNGSGEFSAIPANIPSVAGLSRRIARRIGPDSGYALPRAVYESANYGISADACVNRGQIHRSEWDYLARLARALRVAPNFGQTALLAEPPPWLIDVDESHQEMRVWLRELAVQDMLLAGMEAYLVPAGSGKPSTEIYGIVFGSYRVSPPRNLRASGVSQLDVNVERVCIQHRAKCSPSVVIADERSEATQLAMGEELFPYWHLLGDFHTHTYRSLPELHQQRGWNYSETDENVNIEWCQKLRQLGHRPRIALILAITRAARIGRSTQEHWNGQPNLLRTTIGRCHCFISAYRIRADGRYTTDDLTLKCPHLVGHRTAPRPWLNHAV